MLYAKIIVGLPVSSEFDYIIPAQLEHRVEAGKRVWVNFRNKKIIGYVVGLSNKSAIKNLKPVLEVIDKAPLLNKNMLLLTRRVSEYYCCSWGQALETALPDALRKGKKVTNLEYVKTLTPADAKQEIILLHILDTQSRWDAYLDETKKTLEKKLSVIIILPDKTSVLNAEALIKSKLKISPLVLYRNMPLELEAWQKIASGRAQVVIGLRSAVFAPVCDLGLIILEDEHSQVYKQDQVPHYHAREAASMRSSIEKAKLILGSASVSLESFYSATKDKSKYIFSPGKIAFPETKIIDTRRLFFSAKKKPVLPKILEDSIYNVLNAKGKVLLFLNRKGFATFASCLQCANVLKCPRCSINLVYYFQDNLLKCHYCNFKMEVPKICPNCNSGYIKFSGIGTEKIESEISRIFPQARILMLDSAHAPVRPEEDIFIATSAVIKHQDLKFDLVGILAIDNSLNRIDLGASKKTFDLLIGLLGLTKKQLFILTGFKDHHVFQAIVKRDLNIFYDEELKERRQLKFPPYSHLSFVKLRGKSEDKVKALSVSLFEKLNNVNPKKGIRILSINPGHPAKLRGNFYWQILISASNVKKLNVFLKNQLKDFSHSGIIITVDVDPI